MSKVGARATLFVRRVRVTIGSLNMTDPAALLADRLPRSGRVLVQGCATESGLLRDAIATAGEALGSLTFTGVQVAGLNRRPWLPHSKARFETFFMTPELAGGLFAVTIGMCVLAAISAIIKVVRIDPAVVFSR